MLGVDGPQVEHFQTIASRIENSLPPEGEIHLLGFTDKQYENIVRFSAREQKAQQKKPGQLALF